MLGITIKRLADFSRFFARRGDQCTNRGKEHADWALAARQWADRFDARTEPRQLTYRVDGVEESVAVAVI